MFVYRISYKSSLGSRAVNIRSPSQDLAVHEFTDIYPDREIISITLFRSPLIIFNMISYLYSLEVYKRGSWRPVFYPPQSSTPVQSEHLPFVQDRAAFISSHYNGDRFRIVKTETHLITEYNGNN